MVAKLRPKLKNAIVSALQAGVVPTQGLQYIQVGRVNEVNALVKNIEAVADGGSCFRIVSGNYGAGKTFFLHLARTIALEYKMVTVHADLSPERKLVSSNGQARYLYSELVSNSSTRGRPDGGALSGIVDRFVQNAIKQADITNSNAIDIIVNELKPLQDMVAGWDFSTVLQVYCQGHLNDCATTKENAMRWLRGEYTTKIDARKDLGVRTIIEDKIIYDAIKLFGRFCKIAGYAGLVVVIDECVNLYKVAHTNSRTANYELILRMLNECLQGDASAQNFCILLGFTPESLSDSRRGLFSYEALKSRLSSNRFSENSGFVDYNQPVLELSNLSPEELFVLLRNIREVFQSGRDTELISDDGLEAYMNHCSNKLGADYFQSPRDSVRGFVQLLNLLEQGSDRTWHEILESGSTEFGEQIVESNSSDELATFSL